MDLIILYSCDLHEHNKLTINYVINWMNTYTITYTNKGKELKTMQEILKSTHCQQQITLKQNLKNNVCHLHILWQKNDDNHKTI
jgi:hypothetical protein